MAQRGLDPKIEAMISRDTAILMKGGMDPVMTAYFSHLHLRDPLYLSTAKSKLEEVDAKQIHNSICASVWSHVRLKVPDVDDPDVGWRVEFRPMEIQPTDFANSAFLVFLALVRQTMAWLEPRLRLWMPMELVRDNMERAQARDAVIEGIFWFPSSALAKAESTLSNGTLESHASAEPVLMGIRDIVCGTEDNSWPGLLPLVEQDLAETHVRKASQELNHYLSVIRRRAAGESRTPARWMRDVVRGHKFHRQDSVVTPDISYDLLR